MLIEVEVPDPLTQAGQDLGDGWVIQSVQVNLTLTTEFTPDHTPHRVVRHWWSCFLNGPEGRLKYIREDLLELKPKE